VQDFRKPPLLKLIVEHQEFANNNRARDLDMEQYEKVLMSRL